MIAGIDNAVVLAQQFFPRVFRDTAKLVIDEIDDSRLIGDRHDRRLIEGKLNVGKLFERPFKSVAISNLELFGFFQRMIMNSGFPCGSAVASVVRRSGDFFQLFHSIAKLVAGNV